MIDLTVCRFSALRDACTRAQALLPLVTPSQVPEASLRFIKEQVGVRRVNSMNLTYRRASTAAAATFEAGADTFAAATAAMDSSAVVLPGKARSVRETAKF